MGGAERRPCSGEVSDLCRSGPPRRDRRHYDRPPQGKLFRDGEGGEPAGRGRKSPRRALKRAPHVSRTTRMAFAGRPPPPSPMRGTFFETVMTRCEQRAGTKRRVLSWSSLRKQGPSTRRHWQINRGRLRLLDARSGAGTRAFVVQARAPSVVIAGLVPAIHVCSFRRRRKAWMLGDKRGHEGRKEMLGPEFLTAQPLPKATPPPALPAVRRMPSRAGR